MNLRYILDDFYIQQDLMLSIYQQHDMHVVASSDFIIDMGPDAGSNGGEVVAAGIPSAIAEKSTSKTAPYLKAYLSGI